MPRNIDNADSIAIIILEMSKTQILSHPQRLLMRSGGNNTCQRLNQCSLAMVNMPGQPPQQPDRQVLRFLHESWCSQPISGNAADSVRFGFQSDGDHHQAKSPDSASADQHVNKQ